MSIAIVEDVDTRAAGRRSLSHTFLRKPAGVVALAAVVLLMLVAFLAPWLSPYDPNFVDLSLVKAPPSPEHLLGGDSSGRDVLSRLIWGTQTTFYGSVLACAVSIVIGVPAGIAAGFYGGATDRVGGWTSDALQAVPGMIILLIVAAGTRSDFTIVMVTVGVLLVPGFFRLSRSTTRGIRHELFIDAARVSGLRDLPILTTHVVGHVLPAVVIQGALTIGFAMGLQAGLQFLGIGAADVPNWGAMMNDGFQNIRTQPLLLLWPSLALGIAISAFAVIGSVLADVITVQPVRRRRRPARATPPTPPAMGTTATIRTAEPADLAVVAPSAPPPPSWRTEEPALRIDNLRVNYATGRGEVEVVHGVSLEVAPGEVLGIVGESGSGKSQTVFSALDLLPASGAYTVDALWVDGKDVTAYDKRSRSRLLGTVFGYVPQEPMSNLDPSYSIGFQLMEPLRSVQKLSRREARERVMATLERVGIVDPARVMRSYPHQLSGGMAQRVLIAGAVAGRPSVLIADEPTTALDVTVQAEVLELLRELEEESGMALVIVTHNFGVVADLCDRVVVMRDGVVVESGDVDDIFARPREEYTRALIAASLDDAAGRNELDREYATTEEGR
ncbi:MAG: dipeptide/oligopeptide/nickel ABC transporter permease/ATP-binding protein [Microbacterium sp.]